MARDDLRALLPRAPFPFRSSEYFDWVRLVEFIA
jgi:hypothetical protein